MSTRRHWRWTRAALLVVGLNALGVESALAEEPQEAGQAAKAERLYEEGTKAARAERWVEARDRFREAFLLAALPQIAAQLGRAESALNEYRNAAEHLSFFLLAARDLSDEDKRRAQDMLARAQAKVATIEMHVDALTTKIRVDGQSIGDAPWPDLLYVEPGTRSFEVMGEGDARARVTLHVNAGKRYEMSLSLRPSEAPFVVSTNKSVRWGIAGTGIVLGAVGIGVGIALHVEAQGDSSRSRASSESASLTSLIAGAAIGVGTAVFTTVTVPASGGQTRVGFSPLVLSNGGGISVMGRF